MLQRKQCRRNEKAEKLLLSGKSQEKSSQGPCGNCSGARIIPSADAHDHVFGKQPVRSIIVRLEGGEKAIYYARSAVAGDMRTLSAVLVLDSMTAITSCRR